MISFIKGLVAFVGENYIILDCHDVGYCIFMPSMSLFKVAEGMEVKIHTHMVVKEDEMSLYGFLSMTEMDMFKKLISVSGIGPKGALGILSSISVEELKMAIESGDAKLIASSKGIGLKTAQKLVVELKGKFKNDIASAGIPVSNNISAGNVDTAIAFASAMGISKTQAMKALSKSEIADNASVDDLLDLILKNLSV